MTHLAERIHEFRGPRGNRGERAAGGRPPGASGRERQRRFGGVARLAVTRGGALQAAYVGLGDEPVEVTGFAPRQWPWSSEPTNQPTNKQNQQTNKQTPSP